MSKIIIYTLNYVMLKIWILLYVKKDNWNHKSIYISIVLAILYWEIIHRLSNLKLIWYIDNDKINIYYLIYW